MIEELHIRGLGVIEDTTLVLGPGLTVITGETGAGKTMLVTALQLLLGARASSDLVRRGRDSAIVEAVIRVPDRTPLSDDESDATVKELNDELWALAEDGVLIVAREIPAVGRSRARVAGRLVPTSTLAALLGPHVEVHGQHEHVRLERPAVQRRLLDAFGGQQLAEALAAYRAAYGSWSDAVRRQRLLREDSSARERRREQLLAEREEIDAAALDPVRDATLDQEIDRLANADALREGVLAARDAAGPTGALDALGAALTALRRAPVVDPVLTDIGSRMAAVSRELSEAVADLAAYADDIEADDARLDQLQARKRDVTVLMRRYGASVDAVLDHRDAVSAELADLEALTADASSIDAVVEESHSLLLAAGSRLTESRRASGVGLAAAVQEHLGELALAHATLHVDLAPIPPGPDGVDRVELLLAANPGEPPARLADAASGGERSRIALALEVVLASDRGSGVLVFDEVDAGIGGSTALAVGEKMARLAEVEQGTRQVLCVTHLAQVAAFADAHHLVEKAVSDGRTVTGVRQVEDDERPHVLSRMLGGEATADAGLQHAQGLIDAARTRRGR